MFYLFVFVLGLAVGSFLNVVIDRLPRNEAITGRSHCDFCHKKLAWYDLIPVISFLFLEGQCRFCHKKLSPQYPLIELLTGIAFVLVWRYMPASLVFNTNQNDLIRVIDLGIISCFIAIFFTDFKYRVISEKVLMSLLILAVFLHVSVVFFTPSEFAPLPTTVIELINSFIYGLIVMLPILLLYLVTRARGMGFGDVELAFVMGVLLGLKGGLAAMYMAFMVGGLVGAYLLISHKKKLKSKIAFGPFLVLGTVIMLFFGNEILGLIRHWYGI